MATPKPSISEMLLIGHGNGLKTVDDAWCDYIQHPDLFFSMENFEEQTRTLWDELRTKGFLGQQITTALAELKIPVPDDVTAPEPEPEEEPGLL